MIVTFGLTVLAWVFFRAESVSHAFQYLSDLFLGLATYVNYYKTYRLLYNFGPILIVILLFFIIVEWRGRNMNFAIERLTKNRYINTTFYYIILLIIFLYTGSPQEFIYFQF